MEVLCVAHIMRLVSYGLLLFFWSFCIYYHWLLHKKKANSIKFAFWATHALNFQHYKFGHLVIESDIQTLEFGSGLHRMSEL